MGNGFPPHCLDVLKLVKGKRVISHSPCLDVLKIMMEGRGMIKIDKFIPI